MAAYSHPRRFLAAAAVLCFTSIVGAQATSQPERAPAGTDSKKAEERSREDARRLQELMEKETPAMEDRSKRITAELESLDGAKLKGGDWAKEWAGTYYTGDGLGMNVRINIAPKSGLTYTWRGCLGLYDANHGDIVETFPDGLKVKLAIDEHLSSWHFMSSKLYFVRWGERRYLVPESQMLDLVNHYNEGGRARERMFGIPLKDGRLHDRIPEPTGRPELPPEYAKLIIEQPMKLKVTQVVLLSERKRASDTRDAQYRITLAGGRDQGLFVGMQLSFRKNLTFGSVMIEQVTDTTASGTLGIVGLTDEKTDMPVPGGVFELPGAEPESDGSDPNLAPP